MWREFYKTDCYCGGRYKPLVKRKQYYCTTCLKQIAPLAHTIFRKSDTPLRLWFHAIFIFSNAKSGISTLEMQRQLGVTYDCAYRMLSLIRGQLKQGEYQLQGEVEIDTGFFGGVNSEKLTVIAAVERGGRMKAEVVLNNGGWHMTEFIIRNIKPRNSRLYTDKSANFVKSDKLYQRESVKHSSGEYAKGSAHVNTIERFFGHLKRSIRGTFKVLTKEYFQSYLDAFVFHYNNRHNDTERFWTLLSMVVGTYEEKKDWQA